MPGNNTSVDIESWLATARPRLHRLARLRGVAADAIEDVVQETLLEAWKHQDRLHTPEGFHLWLDEICRNICRRYAHKQMREQQHLLPLRVSSQDEDGADEAAADLLQRIPDADAPDPLEALSRQEMLLLVDRAIGSLSGSAREVVELCYLLELPQREAAARLGFSISALEARLHRARQQLRQALNGPLRAEAEALGLALDAESAGGWRETRLWCTLCGRRRLMGLFVPQESDGGMNLHMRCPDCEERYGLSDVDSSHVHSKGLIQLAGVQSFRPAWKRTMQSMTSRFMQALRVREGCCPYCGGQATLQLIDKSEATRAAEGLALPPSLTQHPYQFWVWWRCFRCGYSSHADMGLFAASDLVYWSHAATQHFMGEHPRWVSEPELLVEYAGQPAIRFQMADMTSAARLTVLAHRQTLDVLAIFYRGLQIN
jgi:RNA polymerase sigma-70 factor (ECF subfamily)